MRTLALLILATLCSVARAQEVWTELGPAPIASGSYSGRVAAIACSTTDRNVYYVGGADGGVWRTDDGGVHWSARGDQLPSTAIGALALEPGNHDVVYAGTGEANFANHSRYGLGLGKSIDGGRSWTIHGASTFAGRCFSRIRIDPSNPATLYASITTAGGFPALAAARNHPGAGGPLGVFKSTDGGMTWVQLAGGLPGNLSATDVALDPSNPRTVYAAIGHIFGSAQNGVYKSQDGGLTFTKLAGGLPGSNVGRITLAVAPSRGNRIYASFVQAAPADGSNGATLNVWKSDDAGASWTAINPGSYQATYGWYLCTSVVSATSPDTFFAGGFTLQRTTNGTGSWSTVTPPHVDLHALEFDAAGRLLCGNDGGIHRSADLGNSWTSLNTNLGLTQFYAGISLKPGTTDVVLGGAQDNGSVQSQGGHWSSVLGGDGGYTGIDPTGARAFAEYQGSGNLFRSVNGGSFNSAGSGISTSDRNCFLPPYEIHPQNPLLMIYGTQRVYQSQNGGTSWSPISPDLTLGGSAAIRGLAFAPSDPKVIYVGTNDGRVVVTSDGGMTWPPSPVSVPGWPRTMRQFAVHPTDAKRAYLAVAVFGTDQVRYTADGGQSWNGIDGDLPDLPCNTVALDGSQGDPPILFAGTDQGVFRSIDNGVHWLVYAYGLPNAPVIDLRVDVQNGRLLAATQGRGLWQVRLIKRNEFLPFAAQAK